MDNSKDLRFDVEDEDLSFVYDWEDDDDFVYEERELEDYEWSDLDYYDN